MFHIGQKVIYIGGNPEYPKGVREIQGLMKAPCCKIPMIDTGVATTGDMVCVCGDAFPSFGMFWKYATQFRPVDFAEDAIAEIEKQAKEETVEI